MMHILDVGSGASAFPALLRQCGFIVTASDSKGSYWSEYSNRHIWVHQDDIASTSLEHGSFDAVVAVSCIEHIEDAAAAVRNMSALARVGGLVVLTFPYSQDEYLDNVYALPAADAMSRSFRYFAHSFSDAQIDEWKLEGALSEVSRTYVRGWTGKYWRTGERLPFAEKVEDPSVANCLCISLKKTD